MPQLNTPLSARRAIAKAEKCGKRIKLNFKDLPKQCDVFLVGLQAHVGEVVTIASPEGRAAIERVFPDAGIEWRHPRVNPGDAFPSDWLEFNFLMRDILAVRHKVTVLVPEHLLKLKPLEDIGPDGFACLLMFGASEQGVRAAMFSEVSQEITVNIPKHLYN